MKRQASKKVAIRNEKILNRIKELKEDHPFWGYRRIWAHLRYIDQLQINKKRVLRIMREKSLLVKRNEKIKAKRSNYRPKPKPTKPNEWWGIDMTKVMVEGFGWIYIVLVLDWFTKEVVGHHIGLESRAKHWLMALEMGVEKKFPDGVRGKGLNLMSDNGCQPTSLRFMKTCGTLDVHQAFTSYNNPKGNADTERMMRTIKEECLWLQEWKSPFDLADQLTSWIKHYNSSYLHSSLNYTSPKIFEQEYYNKQNTLLVKA